MQSATILFQKFLFVAFFAADLDMIIVNRLCKPADGAALIEKFLARIAVSARNRFPPRCSRYFLAYIDGQKALPA